MPDFRSDSVFIVTGASRGIGRACTNILLRNNTRVVSLARTPTNLAPSDSHIHITGSIADPASRRAVVEAAVSGFGRIDGILHNCGTVAPVERLDITSGTQWGEAMQVNFLGPVELTRLALPYLLKSPRPIVVAVSSIIAKLARSGLGAYGCTKAALNRFIVQLAEEHPSMTSVAIGPGMVETSMLQDIRSKADEVMAAEHAAYFKTNKPFSVEETAVNLTKVCLRAPAEWSGKFVDIFDEDMASFLKATKLPARGPA